MSEGEDSTPGKRLRHQYSPEQIELKAAKLRKMTEVTLNQISELLDCKLSPILENIKLLHEQNKELLNENGNLRREVTELKEENYKLNERINNTELRLREKNLIFRNLPTGSSKNKDFKSIVLSTCKDLTVEEVNIIKVAPLNNGRYNNGENGDGQNKMNVTVTFASQDEVKNILENTKALKGTGLFIHRDVPKDIRMQRSLIFKTKRYIQSNLSNVKVVSGNNWIRLDKDKYEIRNMKVYRNSQEVTNGFFDMIGKTFEEILNLNVEKNIKKLNEA